LLNNSGPTWHNTPKGSRVLWTHQGCNSLSLELGTVDQVGKNRGPDTLVTIVLDETQKAVKVKIGELTWAKSSKKAGR
jgi:hypothetical protein